MAHNHDHCHDESHDHNHDDHADGAGPQDNLFAYIDLPNVVALNSEGNGKDVVKPWNKRTDEGLVILLLCCPKGLT